MITTHTRKRIDILIDAPLCDWLIEQAAEVGIAHHSLLRVQSGTGRAGAWSDEGFGTVAKRMFVAVTNTEKVGLLVDRLAPDIERYGLVITIYDVEVIRGERF
jgi:PII-like signaling protein